MESEGFSNRYKLSVDLTAMTNGRGALYGRVTIYASKFDREQRSVSSFAYNAELRMQYHSIGKVQPHTVSFLEKKIQFARSSSQRFDHFPGLTSQCTQP